eukprot:scaffold525682_cov18-Prasinocladus_malaysianus.AAC.1
MRRNPVQYSQMPQSAFSSYFKQSPDETINQGSVCSPPLLIEVLRPPLRSVRSTRTRSQVLVRTLNRSATCTNKRSNFVHKTSKLLAQFVTSSANYAKNL